MVGKITFLVDDKLEKDFRDEVFKKYHLAKRGTVLAVEEALKDWIEKSRKNSRPR